MKELFVGSFIPWLLVLLILILATVLIVSLPRLFRSWLAMPLVAKFFLIVAVSGGMFIRLYLVPNQPRINFDEDRYLSYAVSFARFGKATSLDAASPQKLIKGTPDQAIRTTVPVINGLVLRLVGFNEDYLHITAKVFSSLQIILVYVASFLLFRSHRISSISAIGTAFVPGNVYWSSSTALDSYFVFFMLLSFVASLDHILKPTLRSSVGVLASIFLLLCVRLEAFLFLPVIGLAWISIRNKNSLPIATKKDYVLIMGLIPLIGLRAFASIAVLGERWCCAESLPLEAFSFKYVVRNTLPNLEYLFKRLEFPYFISLLAIYSFLAKKDLVISVLRLWIFLFFSIYSFYYAGLFATPEFSGSYGRYFLSLIPPFLILASITLDDIIRWLYKAKLKIRLFAGSVLLVVVITQLNFFSLYIPIIKRSPFASVVEDGPIATRTFLTDYIIPQIPRESLLIHPLTAYILLSGRTTVYYGDFIDKQSTQQYVLQYVKSEKPAYLILTGECELYPDRCKAIQKLFTLTKVNTVKKNPYGFEFAKLTLKKPIDKDKK